VADGGGSTITGKEGETASRKQVGTWRAFGISLATFVRE